MFVFKAIKLIWRVFWCQKRVCKASVDALCQTEAWYQWILGQDRVDKRFAQMTGRWWIIKYSVSVVLAWRVSAKLSVYYLTFVTFCFFLAPQSRRKFAIRVTVSQNRNNFAWKYAAFQVLMESFLKEENAKNVFAVDWKSSFILMFCGTSGLSKNWRNLTLDIKTSYLSSVFLLK